MYDGRSEIAIVPESETIIRTQVWRKSAIGDLNNDGRNDYAVILVREDPGKTGVLYYAAASVGTGGFYSGTNAVYIGNRISVKNILIKNGFIEIDFLSRPEIKPSAIPENINNFRRFKMQNGVLADITSEK